MSKSFNQKCHLKIHNKIHTVELPFTCEICQKSFPHNDTLKSHNRIHAAEYTKQQVARNFGKRAEFQCKKCQKSFRYHQRLKTHKGCTPTKLNTEQLENTKEQFLCNICDQVFITENHLKKHNKMHGGAENLFSCDLCTFSSDQPVSLEAHLLVRHGL